jgi:hypothetical protein
MIVPKWMLLVIPMMLVMAGVLIDLYLFQGGLKFCLVSGLALVVVAFSMVGGEMIFQRQKKK